MYAKPGALATIALLLMTAGCLGGSPSSTSSPSSTGGSSTGTLSLSPDPTSTTGPSDPPPSGPAPSAFLNASVANGTVPLLVNFTLEDSANSTMAYTWVLDFGDGNETEGTALPATLNHTFESVGNYTVNFTITAGDLVDQESLLIAAEPGRIVLQAVAGAWVAGLSYGCAIDSIAYSAGSPLDGVAVAEISVLASTIGKEFLVRFTDVEDPVVGVYLSFYDADGIWLGRASADAMTPLEGTVPADAALAVIAPCNGGGGSFLYEAGVGL